VGRSVSACSTSKTFFGKLQASLFNLNFPLHGLILIHVMTLNNCIFSIIGQGASYKIYVHVIFINIADMA
jgi:hypothetical protein